uniref:Titin n=1 Tax=Cyprinus carpio TaxID=7962 RepID=A0A8C1MSV8_CYPCA
MFLICIIKLFSSTVFVVPPIVEVDVKLIEGIIVKAGSTIRLPAIMRGLPVPTAKWVIDGEEIKSEGNTKIDTDNFSTVLSIADCTRHHTGIYILTVSNSAGSKTVSLNVTVLDVPAAPIGPVNILEVTPDSMVIEWRPPKEDGGSPVMNYIVEKRESNKETWGGVSSGIKGLTEGTEYRFRVKAVNMIGEGETREIPESVIAKDIVIPPEIEVDATCRDRVTVRVGHNINVVAYVKARPDPEITWSKGESVLEKDKRTTLTNNFPVVQMRIKEATRADHGKYILKAVNEAGEASATITVNVLDRPGHCQNLKLTYVTKNSCMVSWDAPEDNGGTEITNYIVECREPSIRAWSMISSDCTNRMVKVHEGVLKGTFFMVDKCVENHTYQFRVQSTNDGGESAWVRTSDILVKEEVQKPVLDLKFVGTIVVKAGESVRLEAGLRGKPQPEVTWVKEKTTGDNPRISIDTGHDYSKFLLTKTKRSDTGKYVVTATNSAGSFTAYANVTVLDIPGPVRDLKISGISTDKCRVVWDPPEDDGGCEVDSYILEKCETRRMVWSTYSASVVTNYCNVTRLVEGNEYIFRVRAENKMGTGPPMESKPITAKTQYNRPGPPDAPEVTKIGKDEMTVVWAPPENDGGKSITGYILERKEKRAVRWVPVTKSPISERRMKVTNLIPNHEYQFRVKAENQVGLGEPSKPSRPITAKDPIGVYNCVFFFLIDVFICFKLNWHCICHLEPPGPPGSLKVVDSTKTSITLSWAKPVYDGGAPIIGYLVEMRDKVQMEGEQERDPEEGWKKCNTAGQLVITEFTMINLDERQEYEFRVFAQNQVGMSRPANLKDAVSPKDIHGKHLF